VHETIASPPPPAVADVRVWAARLYRYRWLVLLGALLGAAVGFGIAAATPVTFRSTATLMIRQTSAPSPAVAANSMRAVIANHRVASAVVQELGLGVSPAAFIAQSLDIEDVPGTYLLRVSVARPDAASAAQAANAVVREAIALNSALNRSGGEKLERVLQDELGAARKRMDEAEARLTEFRSRQRAGATPPPLHVAEIESARLHAEYDLAARLYSEIAVEFGKLRLQIAEQTYELLVVEDAYPSETPVSVARAASTFFGAVTGLTLSLVLCLLFIVLVPAGDPRR
jgi:uncharacterized protein involved in exopolysaccharide biosynthesis